MKQTIAILAVSLAIILAVTGLIVSANLRQAELITEKTSQQNVLLGKLNAQAVELTERQEAQKALRNQLQAVTKERGDLLAELDATVKTVQAANDRILSLQTSAQQAQALHGQETEELKKRLNASLLEIEALTGERNSAVLAFGENSAQWESDASALAALKDEVSAFSQLLLTLNRFPQGMSDQETAAQELLTAIDGFHRAYPSSPLALPDALIGGLRKEAETVSADAPKENREPLVQTAPGGTIE